MATDEAPEDDWLLQGPADPREVADHYDEWAGSYDDDLVAWSYQAPEVVAKTVVTRQPNAASLLDIGCGTGLVGKALRTLGCTARITGLDISQTSLRVADQTGAYDQLEVADLQQRLDIEDNAFDVLVCVGVMTYLPDVEAVWREFARVVRSGGLVVVTQREDLWEPRSCQEIVDRLTTEGLWTPLDVSGPAPYLPEATGGLGELGGYYVAAQVTDPADAAQ
jgi:ubiquinone/menaquinone biosynthesis C-methylase UbiE